MRHYLNPEQPITVYPQPLGTWYSLPSKKMLEALQLPEMEMTLFVAGWLPPARASARAVAQLFRAVEASTQVLQADDDAAVAEAFGQAVRLLRIGRGAAGDVEPLARVLACIALACRRRLGLWPHPVQLAGARALLAG